MYFLFSSYQFPLQIEFLYSFERIYHLSYIIPYYQSNQLAIAVSSFLFIFQGSASDILELLLNGVAHILMGMR